MVDLIITDPPYGVGYRNCEYDDSEEHVLEMIDVWMYKMSEHLKEGKHCYIFVPTLQLDHWISAVKKYFNFNNVITIRKYSGGRYIKNNYNFVTQQVLFCSKGKAERLRKVDWIPSSDWWLNDSRNPDPKPYTYLYPNFLYGEFSNCHNSKKVHPNEKNVNLIKKFIEVSSDEDDIVLDPFMGSGTTGVAAKLANRKFIGNDANKKWYEYAKDRINKCKVSKNGFGF
jgi:DNA modification methylase